MVHCVHCRVGSLENKTKMLDSMAPVHCRVGSLEKRSNEKRGIKNVHCRVGSLEIPTKAIV